MAGTCSIPVVFAALAGPGNQPLSLFDNSFAAITTYVNVREVTVGTLAARPAPGVSGRWYFSTDAGGQLAVDTGIAWQTVAQASLAGISVENFGAVGDGVHDDTAAIQAAVNAAQAQPVRFGSKNYKVTAAIMLPAAAVLIGQSHFASRIFAGAGGFNIFQMIAGSAPMAGPLIRDLWLDGAGQANVQGVNLNGNTSAQRISQARIQDCQLTNLVVGITLTQCTNTYLDSLYLGSCFIGVDVETSGDNNFSNIEVQNGGDVAFKINGPNSPLSEGHRVIGCSSNGQGEAMSITGCDWGIVEGCSWTSCPDGNVIGMANAHHWRFTGCDIASANGFGGLVADGGCEQVQAVNCFFSLNTFGVSISAGTRHIIANNNFEAGSNTDIVLSNVQHAVVSGNVCDSTGTPGSINELGSANGNAFTGNVCNGTIITVGGASIKTGNIENY